MNQRDGFAGGFLAGTIVGGIVGGVIGALLTQNANYENEYPDQRSKKLADNNKPKRRQFKPTYSDQSIEVARRSLEDKIAQLNDTIDEVRLTLGQVNGNPPETKIERSSRDA